MTYQAYIHEKLKEMALLERVNSQSKQIQLIQKINYENRIKEENKKRDALASSEDDSRDTQLVRRISYNLSQMSPPLTRIAIESGTGKQELMEATVVNLSELEREKLFSRAELYDAIAHIPDDPNRRKTGQEVMMAAIYGEESLPNGKDLLQT